MEYEVRLADINEAGYEELVLYKEKCYAHQVESIKMPKKYIINISTP